MDRLNTWKFALAAAVTFAALSIICALFVIAAPDATLAFFGTWFHGLDLQLLVPAGGKAVTAGQIVVGAIGGAIVSFIAAAMLAASYNFLSGAFKR